MIDVRQYTTSKFLIKIKKQVEKYWPDARLNVRSLRLNSTKIRVYFNQEGFVEIFYAQKSAKFSFALILKQERVFGIDNSRGWHIHPLDNPGKHEPIEEPDLNLCFKFIHETIDKLSLH